MNGDFAGLHVLVSAGPTYEDIDPVRFLGNRSSGKMGFAVAGAAARRGARVTLVAGPVHLETPAGSRRIDVRSAAQMHAAVLGALPADVYVGSAAVADFTPRSVAAGKLRKTPGQEGLTLDLVRTRDILAEVAAGPRRPRLVVGFAAETDAVEDYARGKLQRKGVDMIAANLVGGEGGGFESDDNALLLLGSDGFRRELPRASKAVLADRLLDAIAAQLGGRG